MYPLIPMCSEYARLMSGMRHAHITTSYSFQADGVLFLAPSVDHPLCGLEIISSVQPCFFHNPFLTACQIQGSTHLFSSCKARAVVVVVVLWSSLCMYHVPGMITL